MSRGLSITLIIIASVVGIVLGNLYGRRDVVNSRPPTLSGEFGLPGLFANTDGGLKLTHLNLHNAERSALYGGGAAQITGPTLQAEVQIWKLPEGLGEGESEFMLALYAKDKKPSKELTSFRATPAKGARIRIQTQFTPGDYLVVLPRGNPVPALVSAPIE